jgi:hypothetical protein
VATYGVLVPTEQLSLIERLAATLPRQLSPSRTNQLVRDAVERARGEDHPLTPAVIAELVQEGVEE